MTSSRHGPIKRRRRRKRTVAHQVLRRNLETWLKGRAAAVPTVKPVSRYIERNFRQYLACGIVADGFAWARCANCGHEFLGEFSCMGRGLCPSCPTPQMPETAHSTLGGSSVPRGAGPTVRAFAPEAATVLRPSGQPGAEDLLAEVIVVRWPSVPVPPSPATPTDAMQLTCPNDRITPTDVRGQGKFVLGCRHHVAGAVQEFFVMRR